MEDEEEVQGTVGWRFGHMVDSAFMFNLMVGFDTGATFESVTRADVSHNVSIAPGQPMPPEILARLSGGNGGRVAPAPAHALKPGQLIPPLSPSLLARLKNPKKMR